MMLIPAPYQRIVEVATTKFSAIITTPLRDAVNYSFMEDAKAMATISSVKFNVFKNVEMNPTLPFCPKWKSRRKSISAHKREILEFAQAMCPDSTLTSPLLAANYSPMEAVEATATTLKPWTSVWLIVEVQKRMSSKFPP